MNGDKINGRTPDEIKKGLECCQTNMTTKYKVCGKCGYFNDGFGCESILMRDALALIQQLEREKSELVSENYKLQREMDAAVEQLKEDDRADLFRCSHCKHEELTLCEIVDCEMCDKECPCATCFDMSNWQWRGVREVE